MGRLCRGLCPEASERFKPVKGVVLRKSPSGRRHGLDELQIVVRPRARLFTGIIKTALGPGDVLVPTDQAATPDTRTTFIPRHIQQRP